MTTKVKKKKVPSKILHSFELFAKNFIKVPDNSNNMVSFIMTPEQQELYDNLCKYMVILKGRQIGGTTWGLCLMVWNSILRPNSNYIIVTHHSDVSRSLFRKLKRIYQFLPHDKYEFPKQLLNNRECFELDNGSRIIISCATGGDNISGNTFQMIHLSEMSKYPVEAQEEILSTSIAALAKNRDAVLLIESAGYGMQGLFQDLFMKAWKNSKESIWKPFFFNWLSKGYTELFKEDILESEEYFIRTNKGVRLNESELEGEEKTLRNKHKATFRQLMWRRVQIEKYKGNVQKFKENFPTTPEEAFLGKVESVFDKEYIVNRLQHVLSPIPKKQIQVELDKSLWKYIGKELLIYHPVKHKMRYWAGIDCAAGLKHDDSVMVIFDGNNEEVACFSANDISPWKFSEIVLQLAKYYNMAYLTIERDTGNGNSVIDKLYNDFHYINLHRDRKFNEGGKRKSVIGFQPTHLSKQMMINSLVELISKESILIHSKKTLEQMLIFQNKDGKLGNKRGAANHDDHVISLALCFVGMKKNVMYCDIDYLKGAI